MVNDRITTNSSQGGHIKNAADFFSATPDAGFAGETAGGEVVRSDAYEGSYLLTIELTQFGQLGQESSAGTGAYATLRGETFIRNPSSLKLPSSSRTTRRQVAETCATLRKEKFYLFDPTICPSQFSHLF